MDEESSEEKFKVRRARFMTFSENYIHDIKVWGEIASATIEANAGSLDLARIDGSGYIKQEIQYIHLYWKMMQSSMFIAAEKTVPSFKMWVSKHRLYVIMFCAFKRQATPTPFLFAVSLPPHPSSFPFSHSLRGRLSLLSPRLPFSLPFHNH